MKLFGKKQSAGEVEKRLEEAGDDAWSPPAYDGTEWTAWWAAIEELGGDPSVESFERVVGTANTLLEASIPPPGSYRPGPHRMMGLVELWNAQAEALRES